MYSIGMVSVQIAKGNMTGRQRRGSIGRVLLVTVAKPNAVKSSHQRYVILKIGCASEGGKRYPVLLSCLHGRCQSAHRQARYAKCHKHRMKAEWPFPSVYLALRCSCVDQGFYNSKFTWCYANLMCHYHMISGYSLSMSHFFPPLGDGKEERHSSEADSIRGLSSFECTIARPGTPIRLKNEGLGIRSQLSSPTVMKLSQF